MLGVDGARQGWVGVRWDAGSLDAFLAPTLHELCERAGPVRVVAVDIPILLAADGRRRCDDLARPLLGPRRSSLFIPPATAALDLDDYAEANAWSKEHVGRGLSKQAWMLAPKIREARTFAATHDVPLTETFPELSFRAMDGDRPLTHAKKSWTGLRHRLDLLEAVGIDLPADVGPAGSVAADDLIDAAALAWSGRRIATDTAECLPPDPEPDEPTIWW